MQLRRELAELGEKMAKADKAKKGLGKQYLYGSVVTDPAPRK